MNRNEAACVTVRPIMKPSWSRSHVAPGVIACSIPSVTFTAVTGRGAFARYSQSGGS